MPFVWVGNPEHREYVEGPVDAALADHGGGRFVNFRSGCASPPCSGWDHSPENKAFYSAR